MNKVKVMMVVLLLLVSSPAWTKGPPGVTNGPHNLSTTGVLAGPFGAIPSPYASDEDEICVFCHTPHGGTLTGPLWNRSNPNPAAGWNHYNSATIAIDKTASPLNRTPNNESLLCLSCHDGSVSVFHVVNPPNDRNGAPIAADGTGTLDVDIIDSFNPGTAARIGGSPADTSDTGQLSDDHPISFSYDQVYGAYSLGPKSGQLVDPAIAVTKGVRFFGASGNNVECSSCHDPHVNYIDNPVYTPFLVMSNSGSAMCLACHNK